MTLAEKLQKNHETNTSIEELTSLANFCINKWVDYAHEKYCNRGVVIWPIDLFRSLPESKKAVLQAIGMAILNNEGFATELDILGNVEFWIEDGEKK